MSNDEVKKFIWRYSDGFHVKDVLEFDNNNLRGDTIYSKNEPVAIIIERSKEIPFVSSYIEIKDFNSEEVGTYHEIGTLR